MFILLLKFSCKKGVGRLRKIILKVRWIGLNMPKNIEPNTPSPLSFQILDPPLKLFKPLGRKEEKKNI